MIGFGRFFDAIMLLFTADFSLTDRGESGAHVLWDLMESIRTFGPVYAPSGEDWGECISASAWCGSYAPEDLIDPDGLLTKLALHFLWNEDKVRR